MSKKNQYNNQNKETDILSSEPELGVNGTSAISEDNIVYKKEEPKTEEVKEKDIITVEEKKSDTEEKIAKIQTQIDYLQKLLDSTWDNVSRCKYYDKIMALKQDIKDLQNPHLNKEVIKKEVTKEELDEATRKLTRGEVYGNRDILVSI